MKSHFSWDFVLAPFQLKNIAVVNSSAKKEDISTYDLYTMVLERNATDTNKNFGGSL